MKFQRDYSRQFRAKLFYSERKPTGNSQFIKYVQSFPLNKKITTEKYFLIIYKVLNTTKA